MAKSFHEFGDHILRFSLPLMLVTLTWSLSSGCSKSPTSERPALENGKTLEEGTALFEKRCFVCHGRTGKGDGPTSQGAAVRPRDLTDHTWQNSTSDAQITKVIRNGGQSVGKSAAMPPNPDLTNVQVQGLSLFIRSLDEK